MLKSNMALMRSNPTIVPSTAPRMTFVRWAARNVAEISESDDDDCPLAEVAADVDEAVWVEPMALTKLGTVSPGGVNLRVLSLSVF